MSNCIPFDQTVEPVFGIIKNVLGFSSLVTRLTDSNDIVPWIRCLVSSGWWMTGQTILVNGGYTTK